MAFEKGKALTDCFQDPANMRTSGRSMAAFILARARELREAWNNAPLCPGCGLKDRAAGVGIGCRTCIVHAVLES